MGQKIEIEASRIVDDSIIVSTNRSLTGTDGEGFDTAEDAGSSGTFAAGLAKSLFAADGDLQRVFVTSNVVVIKRDGGWPDDAAAGATKLIEEFFLFYPAA